MVGSVAMAKVNTATVTVTPTKQFMDAIEFITHQLSIKIRPPFPNYGKDGTARALFCCPSGILEGRVQQLPRGAGDAS